MTAISKNRPQYSPESLHRYEIIFGRDFVSTGGPETTRAALSKLDIQPGQRVFDVGCGVGGSAFLMARELGARITGVDLLPQMINAARERLEQYGLEGIEFIEGDILEMDIEQEAFDWVYSRDAFIHIADKSTLFKRLYDALKPGGQLFLTDYGCGPQPWTEAFQDYQADTAYDLRQPAEYGAILEAAGFEQVEARDETDQFVEVLKRERDDALAGPEGLSDADRDYLVDRWNKKLGYCDAGDMRWIHVTAKKA